MPWDKNQRERIAGILALRPVQSIQGKKCVVISELHRDAIVRELRVGKLCECREKVETKVCFDKEPVRDRPGLWKIFKWAGEKLHG